MDEGLILAGSCAGLAALMGNRTALALLCSAVAAMVIGETVYPSHPDLVSALLFLLDIAVLCVILRPNMTLADELIAALFVVAWAAYFADDQLRYDTGYAVVVLQMILTLPIQRLQKGRTDYSHGSSKGVLGLAHGGV